MAELISIDEFLAIPLYYMKFIGRYTYSENNVLRFKSNWLFWFSVANTSVTIFLELVYFNINVIHGEVFDFLECVFIILCISFILISWIKITSTLFNDPLIFGSMKSLFELYPKTVQLQKDYGVFEYVTQTQRIMRVYSILSLIMITLFSILPVAEAIDRYNETGVWHLEYSFLLYYPFDPYKPSVFYIIYALQLAGAYTPAIGIFACDILLLGLVMQTCMQFDALKKRFLAMKGKNKKEEMAELKNCVELHYKIMRFDIK